jgi:acyl-CoA thioester hydrolase
VGQPFRHQLRVRYAECDTQGVVFNAHYLAYFDVCINELLREACGSYHAMLDSGLDIVVAEAKMQFRAPARFEEQLTLEVGIAQLGTTSIISDHRITRNDDLLVEGATRHVVVDRSTVRKRPIPDWLRSGLEPWTVPRP